MSSQDPSSYSGIVEIYPPSFEVFPSVHCVPVVYIRPVLMARVLVAFLNHLHEFVVISVLIDL